MGGISFLDNHLQRRAGRMLSVFIRNHHSLLLCIWNLRLWGDIGDDDICYSKQYIRVNGGWRETDFWDVCTTQHFSFYPDIYAKHLGGWIPIQKYSSCVTFNEGGTTSPGPIFFWKN